MPEPDSILTPFREHLVEVAQSWYDGDEAKAFRHVSFAQSVPGPSLADTQIIEMTRIDRPGGDLEIDGWYADESEESFLLFQAAGGQGRADEAKALKFWAAPDAVLDPARVAAYNNPALEELSKELAARLRDGYDLKMIFASRGGFAPAAKLFARGKVGTDRALSLLDGTRISCICTLELLDERDIAQRFDDYRAGFSRQSTNVELSIDPRFRYEVDATGQRSLRATLPASEIVRVFRAPGMGFRLFSLNPRGPLANAKVNKSIARTLASPAGRRTFHLLNNGLCATCDGFSATDGILKVMNLQIVNGCQTTVTLHKQEQEVLDETLVDLKLTVADAALASQIAEASNSQTALKAKDFAAFERQQLQLQNDFAGLQPPYYYEIKQGYWRFVLTDAEKAIFKTGQRKRHIEVQPLAQAALAFLGHPADALDKVRMVFEGIRTPEERASYERAFPPGAKAEQLLLAWALLDWIERQETDGLRYSTFHSLWLMSWVLKQHYGVGDSDFLSPTTSVKLVETIREWAPGLDQIAIMATTSAFRRAQGISPTMELRDFFRGKEISPNVTATQLISEAGNLELKLAAENKRDPRDSLPA